MMTARKYNVSVFSNNVNIQNIEIVTYGWGFLHRRLRLKYSKHYQRVRFEIVEIESGLRQDFQLFTKHEKSYKDCKEENKTCLK